MGSGAWTTTVPARRRRGVGAGDGAEAARGAGGGARLRTRETAGGAWAWSPRRGRGRGPAHTATAAPETGSGRVRCGLHANRSAVLEPVALCHSKGEPVQTSREPRGALTMAPGLRSLADRHRGPRDPCREGPRRRELTPLAHGRSARATGPGPRQAAWPPGPPHRQGTPCPPR